MADKSVVPEGMKAWTVWDAEERMAREGDWRGVAYSIAHDILPLIPEGSPDHAYQQRARMQIKAADRLTAAVLAAASVKSASPANPLSLETSDLDPITPEEDAVATKALVAMGWTRQSYDSVVRMVRVVVAERDNELSRFVRMVADLRNLQADDFDATYPAFNQALKNRTSAWDGRASGVTCLAALIDEAIRLSAHSIQSGGEGGAS